MRSHANPIPAPKIGLNPAKAARKDRDKVKGKAKAAEEADRDRVVGADKNGATAAAKEEDNHNKIQAAMAMLNLQRSIGLVTIALSVSGLMTHGANLESLIAPGAKLQELAGGFQFGEGPAADTQGNVFFSDIRGDKCCKWSVEGKLSTFRTDTGNANGQCFDRNGNLIVCESGRGRLVSVDRQAQATVVVEQYQGKRFNAPNDLWVAPGGGIYFSDPLYGRGVKAQDGEHVYYLKPDRKTLVRVINDLVRPNGLVGTPDGRKLFVSDHGAKKIYAYDISSDGALSNKRFFAPVGADGMTIDTEGNLYFCEDAVLIYDPSGKKLGSIEVPQQPTNVCFGGREGKTLFITTRPTLYSIEMRVSGTANSPRQPSTETNTNTRPRKRSLPLQWP